MRWISKLFGTTPKKELNGIQLDTSQPFWKLEGKTNFSNLFNEFTYFLPDSSILYFEGGSPDKKLLLFFESHAIAEQTHVGGSILWPRPKYYHVPATPQNLEKLSVLSKHLAEPELAVHFHVYLNGKILLEWYDAFSQPMLLSGEIPEYKVANFAQKLSMKVTNSKT